MRDFSRSPSGRWVYLFLAFLAVTVPVLWPSHRQPTVMFYNQILAILGWAAWTLAMNWPNKTTPIAHAPASAALTAASMEFFLIAGSALGASAFGPLPWGISVMGAGMALAAWWVMQCGWWGAERWSAQALIDTLAMGLAIGGALCAVYGLLQMLAPPWLTAGLIPHVANGERVTSTLRQPNQFSTFMILSMCCSIWLGRRQRWPFALSIGLMILCVAGVVGSGSRTGMVSMGVLLLWSWQDKGMALRFRGALLTTPLWYGLWWLGFDAWHTLNSGDSFGALTRPSYVKDMSNGRAEIWTQTLGLIGQQPWTGVGWGQFNAAWSLTVIPNRIPAFFDNTHNLLLQWAVELGLPIAIVLTLLAGFGLWPLWRHFLAGKTMRQSLPDERRSVVLFASIFLGVLALHSMLEYPLWYSYFLLPAAFVWGVGLFAASDSVHIDQQNISSESHSEANRLTAIWRLIPSALILVMAAWCYVDFEAAANIYSPNKHAPSLQQRIANSQNRLWFGYQADYALVTNTPPEKVAPAAFKRIVFNLLDTRLMTAYVKSLATHGEIDKARYVMQRLAEFKRPATKQFLALCDTDPTGFQCAVPKRDYHWREVLP